MGLIQLSMDGPSTNWKLLDELSEDRLNSDPALPELINVGSCGLHIIHGTFERGAIATGWHIVNLLQSLWYLFPDAPAKKEDYMKVSTSKKIPITVLCYQMVRGCSSCRESHSHMARYPSVYSSNLCRM